MNNECFDYFDVEGVNFWLEWGCGIFILYRMVGYVNGDRKKNIEWSYYV